MERTVNDIIRHLSVVFRTPRLINLWSDQAYEIGMTMEKMKCCGNCSRYTSDNVEQTCTSTTHLGRTKNAHGYGKCDDWSLRK